MSSLSDLDQLIVRLAAGDRSAFPGVFQLVWPRIRALCLSLLKHPQDAEDAAQQAMEKVLTRAAEYESSRPALPWALAIAAWECRTIRTRTRRRREVAVDDLEDLEIAPSVEDRVVHWELEMALVDALRTLSETDRGTLIAAYWDLGMANAGATLRKRRQRALDRLRAAFRRLYGF